MEEIKENITKACGYCLKVFETKNDKSIKATSFGGFYNKEKLKVGCNDCEAKIDWLIHQGTLSNFLPKTFEERIKKLEKISQRKIEELEREIEELKRKC